MWLCVLTTVMLEFYEKKKKKIIACFLELPYYVFLMAYFYPRKNLYSTQSSTPTWLTLAPQNLPTTTDYKPFCQKPKIKFM